MNNCVWLLETKWPNGWKPIGRVYRTERNAANAKAQMERHEWAGKPRVVCYAAIPPTKKAEILREVGR